MSSVRIVNADELRANVRFEDLIEPISRAFHNSPPEFTSMSEPASFTAFKMAIVDIAFAA